MKVFISWSGDRSEQVAEALHVWLPNVIQIIEPWLSQSDIEKGVRWSTDLASQLSDAQFGLICLTPENLTAPWLMFEAGALSKTLSQTHVCPYLYDLDPLDVTGPLVQFQATRAAREDTAKLLHTMNRALGETALSEARLDQYFDVWWPDLERRLAAIPNVPEFEKARRSQDDMLRETVGHLRFIRQEIPSLVRDFRAAGTDKKKLASVAAQGGLALTRAFLSEVEQRAQGELDAGEQASQLPPPSAVEPPA